MQLLQARDGDAHGERINDALEEEVAGEEHQVDDLIAGIADEVQEGTAEIVKTVFKVVLLIAEMYVPMCGKCMISPAE